MDDCPSPFVPAAQLVLDTIADCFIYGDLSPNPTSAFHIAGTYNGKTYFSNLTGTWYIIWDGIDSWYINNKIKPDLTDGWKLTAASHIGIYSPHGTMTGNAIITTYEGIQYNFTGTVSPDVTGPVYQLGMKAGKELYITEDSEHYMQWWEASTWIVATNLKTPDTGGFWSAERADPPGILTPTLPNTGDLTCAVP